MEAFSSGVPAGALDEISVVLKLLADSFYARDERASCERVIELLYLHHGGATEQSCGAEGASDQGVAVLGFDAS